MPAIPEEQTDSLQLPIEGEYIDIVTAETSDPVFPKLQPDDHRAYSIVRFAHCLPVVMGPESRNGAVFGLHPAVISRGFPSVIHQQMNREHKMHYLGAKDDAVVGCVLHAVFPEEPEGGWVIGADDASAPHIRAQGVLFKQAKGVDKMLGEHLSGRTKMAVSMEMSFYHQQTGIWDRRDGAVYDRKEIPQSLKGYLFEDDKGRLLVRKGGRADSLVAVMGGKSGKVWFSGVAYTGNPAEWTAAVDSIAASAAKDAGLVLCSSLSAVEWTPGMQAAWSGGWGCGKVVAAHYSGTHRMWGMSFEAKESDPVLVLELPDKVRILRRASSVSRKI
jgi:hypothetical protein